PAGGAAVLVAVLAWSAGSLYSRSRPFGTSALMGAAANMITGGILFLGVGLALGEFSRLGLHATSARSAIALLYLIFIGALVGFTAFFYVLQHTTPAKSTTYAYVNPVVAIILGWAILDEPITRRILLAAGIIISGVVMITALPHV